MSKKKSNNSKKEKVNSSRKINKSDISENELLNEEKKSSSFEEQINIEKDKFLRLFAEFENFRKRTAKEKIDIITNASERLLKDIIPVIDDFERAITNNKDVNDASTIKEGFELIYNKLYKTLTDQGLKPMDAAGKVFDTDIHEAITNIPAPSKKMKGKVVDVIEKGYMINDKVIRFAKVVVGE